MKKRTSTDLSVVTGPCKPGRVAGNRLTRSGVDSDYIFGISEIDAQHDEIERILIDLQAAVDKRRPWPVNRPALEHLHEKLTSHFALEEAVMHLFSRPDTQDHSRVHAEILGSLEIHMNGNPTGLTWQVRIEHALPRVCEQIRSHDVNFVKYLNMLKNRLLRPHNTLRP